MNLDVKIEGLDRINQATERVRVEIVKELDKGLFASAKKVEGDAKRSILDGQKSGRTYKRGNVLHRASAPGEAPASDTGRLANSINSEVIRGTLEAVVRAGNGVVKYARMLEFGTISIAARPFFQPAAEKNRAWIVDRLNKAVRTAAINASKK